MSRNEHVVSTTPDRVWEVLADGWLFALWVVGASRVRDVDPEWPSVGAKIHHSVGAWPLLINDNTEVTEQVKHSRLGLLARIWPVGEASVTLDLAPSGAGTLVTMTEEIVSGPGRVAPNLMVDPALALRNAESLRRLAFVAEGRP